MRRLLTWSTKPRSQESLRNLFLTSLLSPSCPQPHPSTFLPVGCKCTWILHQSPSSNTDKFTSMFLPINLSTSQRQRPILLIDLSPWGAERCSLRPAGPPLLVLCSFEGSRTLCSPVFACLLCATSSCFPRSPPRVSPPWRTAHSRCSERTPLMVGAWGLRGPRHCCGHFGLFHSRFCLWG